MFERILVVCVGNICRSPTGERLLQNRFPDKAVSSAGIAALVGREADESAQQVALMHGLSLKGHRARQLTAQLCIESDLILVMEKSQIETVAQYHPSVRGKTMLFGRWLEQKEIPDPYRQGREAFEYVFNLMEQAADSWLGKL